MPPQSPDIADCVRRIEELLGGVIALQRPHVLSVCAACPDPCCARVQHLFDEKDIFFLRLSGRKAGLKRGPRKGMGCRHHTPAGCGLDPIGRPFACHRYLCVALRQSIARSDPAVLTELQRRVDELDRLRSLLWCSCLEHEAARARPEPTPLRRRNSCGRRSDCRDRPAESAVE